MIAILQQIKSKNYTAARSFTRETLDKILTRMGDLYHVPDAASGTVVLSRWGLLEEAEILVLPGG